MTTMLDGGPAYPSPDATHAHAIAQAALERADLLHKLTTEDRDRFYLVARGEALAGLSKRDVFAKAALQAMLGSRVAMLVAERQALELGLDLADVAASTAYTFADAMLRARARRRDE